MRRNLVFASTVGTKSTLLIEEASDMKPIIYVVVRSSGNALSPTKKNLIAFTTRELAEEYIKYQEPYTYRTDVEFDIQPIELHQERFAGGSLNL